MLRTFLRFLDTKFNPLICWTIFLSDTMFKVLSFKWHENSVEHQDFKKILVVKIAGMGDTVLMLPSLKALRKAYPESEISALLTPLSKGVLVNQPILDDVIIYDIWEEHKGITGLARMILTLRRRQFDLVIDFDQPFYISSVFSYSTRADTRIGYSNLTARARLLTRKVPLDDKKHACDSFADLVRPLGINISTENLEEVWISELDSRYVEDWLKKEEILENEFMVGIHPGCGGNVISRRWPKDRFAQIADRLSEIYGTRVIITGSTSEIELANEVACLMRTEPVIAAGQMSIGQLAGLIDRLDLYISNDTGPMHISAAMGTPTIGLFGPETPVRYGPYGNQHLSVYKPPLCSPCINVHRGERSDCKQPSTLCMEAITVEDVWEAVEKILKKNGVRTHRLLTLSRTS